jgi:hypothetical protein
LRRPPHPKSLQKQGSWVGDFLADKYSSAAGKRRWLYINTVKAFNELMADICRQKTDFDYPCHP